MPVLNAKLLLCAGISIIDTCHTMRKTRVNAAKKTC